MVAVVLGAVVADLITDEILRYFCTCPVEFAASLQLVAYSLSHPSYVVYRSGH